MATELRPFTIALLGGRRHEGAFAIGPKLTHVAVVGGLALDLGAAELPPDGVTVTKVSLVGGVSLVVPPEVRVEVEGFTVLGGRDVDAAAATATGPAIRVRAFGLAGGVKVRVAG